MTVVITVHHGRLNVETIRLSNGKQVKLKQPAVIEEGRSRNSPVQSNQGQLWLIKQMNKL